MTHSFIHDLKKIILVFNKIVKQNQKTKTITKVLVIL